MRQWRADDGGGANCCSLLNATKVADLTLARRRTALVDTDQVVEAHAIEGFDTYCCGVKFNVVSYLCGRDNARETSGDCGIDAGSGIFNGQTC